MGKTSPGEIPPQKRRQRYWWGYLLPLALAVLSLQAILSCKPANWTWKSAWGTKWWKSLSPSQRAGEKCWQERRIWFFHSQMQASSLITQQPHDSQVQLSSLHTPFFPIPARSPQIWTVRLPFIFLLLALKISSHKSASTTMWIMQNRMPSSPSSKWLYCDYHLQ